MSSCTVSRADFTGWDAVRLGNGIIELFVVPQIGGRIIQLRVGGHALFYVNPRHLGRVYPPEENNSVAGWKNYGGSKVWPAPQGWSASSQWPGPPDPILDGGPYHLRVIEDHPETAAVYIESPEDHYTGLKFAREIRIFRNSSAIRIVHKMRNTSSRPARWGIWQVTQQGAEGGLSVFVPETTYRQIYGEDTYHCIDAGSDENPLRVRYTNQVAKLLLNPGKPWIAAVHGKSGTVLVETFAIFKDLPYPDDASVELWVNGKGFFTIHGERMDTTRDPNGCDAFIETEIVSPFAKLEPGQGYTFEIFWNCAFLQGNEVKAADRVAAIAQPLTVTLEGKMLKLRGAYGVFHIGHLEVAGISGDGKELLTHTSGSVSPLEPCSVEEYLPYKDGISKVRLRLRGLEGKILGIVDEAML